MEQSQFDGTIRISNSSDIVTAESVQANAQARVKLNLLQQLE